MSGSRSTRRRKATRSRPRPGSTGEPACLDFHETRRAVRTASAGQVRQKMYTGSSEAWRRYASHLAPLLEALDNVG